MNVAYCLVHRALPVPATFVQRRCLPTLGALFAVVAPAWTHPLDQGGAFTPIQHIAFHRGHVFVADTVIGAVRVLNSDGTLAGRIGAG
ncbi:MAG: hypothetical protein H5T86_15660, partial [Armatimonadetes bacterium]|nr:hypothetical protein [Armatimonadota bacterium]